jgi:hypothetical protein
MLYVFKYSILIKDIAPSTISFVHDKVIMANTEDELQRAAYTLNNMAIK